MATAHEGREHREEVEVDKGDLEVQQNPPVAKRTWLQTAAAAGVLAMVREGEAPHASHST